VVKFIHEIMPGIKTSIVLLTLCACALIGMLAFSTTRAPRHYEVIIRNGTIFDGTGDSSYRADIGINADTIAAIGSLSEAKAEKVVDATGMIVAPGFINMLSWSDQIFLKNGSSMSDLKQGVTLEIFGEGWSPAPIRRNNPRNIDSLYNTLDGYFKYLMKKGTSCNVASFVGATSVRIHVMDHASRKPDNTELQKMKQLVAEAMEHGAFGLGTSLIYTPAAYATTDELVELAKVASSYGGMYITHMRSEADHVLTAVDEVIEITKRANIHSEIYHLKINIPRNWNKIDRLLIRIDSAKRTGLPITANMYPYTASATGLSSRLPAWVQEGGSKEMRKRLRDPVTRKRVLSEMEQGIPYKNSDPESVVLLYFRLDSLNKLYRGKKLSDAARIHGKSADETVIDLVVRDKSRIEALYKLQSEENVRKVMKLPYVSFGSDAGSYDLRDTATLSDHPRAFGTFARVLGKYVREEKVLPMSEAIRRMTSLPATNLKLKKRGLIKQGYFADVVVFNPAQIIDKSTFENPHQYAEGVTHVFVNGVHVIEDGNHTGARPGRVLRGPGYKKPARKVAPVPK
jgi:N-acyl-D-amino-acid deacylase